MAVKDLGLAEDKLLKTVCSNCLHNIAYAPIDIKERTSRDYDGGSDTTRYIICAKCGKDISVRLYSDSRYQ